MGKVLFIDALNEVTRERAQSFLKPAHQQRVLQSFHAFAAEEGFSAVATLEKIIANGSNPSIPLYVKKLLSSAGKGVGSEGDQSVTLNAAWAQWQTDGRVFWQQMDALVETLDGLERT